MAHEVTCAHYLRFFCLLLIGFLSLPNVGFQSLLPVLVHEGIFESLCSESWKSGHHGNNACNDQSLRLEMMFEISLTALNTGTWFWGTYCFKVGPRITMLTGAIVAIASSIAFSFGYDWLCFCSFITLGFAGGGLLVPCFTVPLEYDFKIQGTLFSVLMAGIDASSVIYFIFKNLYFKASGGIINFSFRVLFLSLAVVYTVAALAGVFYLFNSNLFVYNEEEQTEKDKISGKRYSINSIEEGTGMAKSSQKVVNTIAKEPLLDNDAMGGSTSGDEHGITIARDIAEAVSDGDDIMVGKDEGGGDTTCGVVAEVWKELVFWVILIWACLYISTKYFYIASLNTQLKWITNDNEHEMSLGTNVFNILLPCAGVFGITAGTIIGKGGVKLAVTLMGIMSIAAAVTSVIKIFELQFFTMVCMIYNRFFYFVIAPLIVGNKWGMKKQSLIYGFILFCAALFSLLGYAWDALAIKVLDGNFTIINLVLGAACLIFSLTLAYLV